MFIFVSSNKQKRSKMNFQNLINSGIISQDILNDFIGYVLRNNLDVTNEQEIKQALTEWILSSQKTYKTFVNSNQTLTGVGKRVSEKMYDLV